MGELPLPVDDQGAQSEKPVFSIVTASLNQARYLPDALSSVRNQEKVRSEHIVVDGVSDDGTAEILRTAPGNVRYVIERDWGQSDALNKALDRVRGSIVGWLNADDYYLPGALAAVENYFASNPDVQVVHGDTVVVDERGNLLYGKADHPFDSAVLLYYGCYIPSTATFFRSELVESGLLRLDTSLRQAMDYELFLRLATAGVKFGYIPRDLSAFRWHGSNVSGDASAQLIETRRVQETYGAFDKGRLAFEILRRVYRLKHGLMLAYSGGLLRRRRWRRLRGAEVRR